MTNTVNAERLGYAVPDAKYPDIDDVTVADNGGVRTLFDLAFPKCYPGGPFAGRPAPGAGIEGAVLYDMTRTDSGNGDLSVAMVPENGSSLPWVGGGFDLSDTTAGETAGGTSRCTGRHLESGPCRCGIRRRDAALSLGGLL